MNNDLRLIIEHINRIESKVDSLAETLSVLNDKLSKQTSECDKCTEVVEYEIPFISRDNFSDDLDGLAHFESSF